MAPGTFYDLVWSAAYASAWHHEYRRALETTDAADRHAAALNHGRERQCIDVADRAVDDLRRADKEDEPANAARARSMIGL